MPALWASRNWEMIQKFQSLSMTKKPWGIDPWLSGLSRGGNQSRHPKSYGSTHLFEFRLLAQLFTFLNEDLHRFTPLPSKVETILPDPISVSIKFYAQPTVFGFFPLSWPNPDLGGVISTGRHRVFYRRACFLSFSFLFPIPHSNWPVFLNISTILSIGIEIVPSKSAILKKPLQESRLF
jgi:hypothetical protein